MVAEHHVSFITGSQHMDQARETQENTQGKVENPRTVTHRGVGVPAYDALMPSRTWRGLPYFAEAPIYVRGVGRHVRRVRNRWFGVLWPLCEIECRLG